MTTWYQGSKDGKTLYNLDHALKILSRRDDIVVTFANGDEFSIDNEAARKIFPNLNWDAEIDFDREPTVYNLSK